MSGCIERGIGKMRETHRKSCISSYINLGLTFTAIINLTVTTHVLSGGNDMHVVVSNRESRLFPRVLTKQIEHTLHISSVTMLRQFTPEKKNPRQVSSYNIQD